MNNPAEQVDKARQSRYELEDAEQQHADEAYIAEQSLLRMRSQLGRLNQDGLPLREAEFIPAESRQRIAGLIATFAYNGIPQTTTPRTRNRKETLILGRQKQLESDFATGWLVGYKKGIKGPTTHIIATPDYRVLSFTRDDSTLSVDKFTKPPDDVVARIAEENVAWVEPDPDTYQ